MDDNIPDHLKDDMSAPYNIKENYSKDTLKLDDDSLLDEDGNDLWGIDDEYPEDDDY